MEGGEVCMSSIDERVVGLKFDNKQFEQGTADSLSALDKLKNALRLDGSTKGLSDIDSAAKKVDLSNIERGVQSIEQKFSAMSVVAITALANIATAAFRTGADLVKSVTLQPVLDGFNEYELKMRSIQTILANTSKDGTKLKDVSNALDELNTYADKTIYNFADMTKNVGFFTNAGVKLEDATALIKGFSNEAAASGTEAGAAAGAAYQLAQAFNAGVIRLMDWRSLTNVGMGSANMRDGLIDIAQAMGQFNSETTSAKAAHDNFNASLEAEWLTAEVMQNYLKIQAGELSDEQMRALGLTKKQIKAFKDQAEIAEDAATKVRTWTALVSTIQEAVASGWTDTFNTLIGDFDEATELFTGISETVGGYFDRMSKQRNDTLKAWKELGGRDELLQGLKNIGEAIVGAVKPITQAFRDIFPRKTAEQLYEMTKSFASFTEKLKIGEDTSNNLRRIFSGIFAIFSVVKTVLGSVIKFFLDFWVVLGGGSGGVLSLIADVADLVVAFDEWLKRGQYIENFFDRLIAARRLVMEPLVEWVSALVEAFGLLFKGDFAGFGDALADSFSLLEPLIIGIQNSVTNTVEKLQDFGARGVDGINKAASAIGDFFAKIVENLSWMNDIEFSFPGLGSATSGLGKLGEAGDSAGGAVQGVVEWLKNAASNVGNWIRPIIEGAGEIAVAVKDSLVRAFEDMEGIEWAAFINTGFFVAMYLAIRKFFKNFGDLIEAATDVIEGLGDTLKTFQHNVQATILLKIAAAVAILAASVYLMASIPEDDLWRSLAGVGALLAGVVATMIILTKLNFASKGGLSKIALALILISYAVNILADATAEMSGLSWEEIARGLVAVGGILLALGLFAKFAEAEKMSIRGGIGLLLLAAAVKIIASAVKDLGEMDTGELVKGVAAIAALLGAVSLLSFVLGKYEGDLLKASFGLLIMSGALYALSLVIERYAGMDILTFGIGLGLIGIGIGIVGRAMSLIPNDAPAKAFSIGLVAGALGLLSFVIEKLGNMDPAVLAKGVITIGGALAGIVIALNLMKGSIQGAAAIAIVAASLYILTGVMERLGQLSWEQVAIGLAALAGVLLVVIGAAYLATPIVPVLFALAASIFLLGAAVGVAALGIGLFAAGLAMLATVGVAGAAAITLALTAFLNMLPLLGQQAGLAVIAFAKVIEESAPRVATAMVAVGNAFLDAAIELVPKFGALMSQLIETGLDVLEGAIPDMVATGYRILLGVLDGINDNIGEVVDAATDVAISFIEAVGENALEFIDAGAQVIIDFVQGLADTIDRRSEDMRAAGRDLAWAIINGMTGGLADGAINVVNAITGMASRAWEAAKSFFESKSPSKLFMRLGRWNAEGLAIGIDKFGYKAADATENMGKKSIDAMRKSISDLSSMVDEELNADPTIRPVLDMSGIQDSDLSRLLGSAKIGVETSSSALIAQAQYDANLLEALRLATEASEVAPIQFVQNNTSPKALSVVELYRQTNNQISTAKGVLNI